MAEAEKYEILEKIGPYQRDQHEHIVLTGSGHGSFGIIRKVRRKHDGYVLCRKEISYLRMSSKEREQLQAELSILKGLRHPNIVAYYEREHLKAASDLHIYMEYCEHGDLGRYIKELKTSNKMADEDFVWSVFSQLVMALYRCHYGEDPPEVGRNVMGLSSDAKPARKTQHANAMILHRDLKPENIFLGSDASVKLGDFGLSKIMQAHDFASTYVGTPYYMSPEICAAEQYSLHSDIWAFGCIMYELCSKEPPFNAKTHLELIQRIRLGKVTPLSHLYSTELKESINRCLRVNPMTRPDTAQLLNIPMVKLKRKELEVVRLGRQMKNREEQAARTLKDAEIRLAQVDADKQATRAEIDSTLRREWEVKARLEIDCQVQQTREELRRQFEAEVARRVVEELSKKESAQPEPTQELRRSTTPCQGEPTVDTKVASHQQSQSTAGETDDFPSSTDLSELSLESPSTEKQDNDKPQRMKRSNRAPFARAQTMFEGSPADVNMVDPSPAPIHSLNLSPRRDQHQPAPHTKTRNIFTSAESSSPLGSDADDDDDDDDDDGLGALHPPGIASPTGFKNPSGDPFKQLGSAGRRPGLLRQKTMPQNKVGIPGTLFPQSQKAVADNTETSLATAPSAPRAANRSTSPSRRMSKLPSAANLVDNGNNGHRRAQGPTSPQRRPPSRKQEFPQMRHTAALNHHVQGRTLVELAQARTAAPEVAAHDFADDATLSCKNTQALDREDVTVWDPERDEMPSPFLAKKGRNVLPGRVGGPGLRHLR
ncbi:MAG: hypothetical protein Q9159_001614 [Coniocarpon cinnabarinum]